MKREHENLKSEDYPIIIYLMACRDSWKFAPSDSCRSNCVYPEALGGVGLIVGGVLL